MFWYGFKNYVRYCSMHVYIAAPLNSLGSEKLDLEVLAWLLIEFIGGMASLARRTALQPLTLLTLLSC